MYSYGVMYHDFLPNFFKKNMFSVFVVVAMGSISSASQYRGVLVGLATIIPAAR
jgi:hypothetical protein